LTKKGSAGGVLAFRREGGPIKRKGVREERQEKKKAHMVVTAEWLPRSFAEFPPPQKKKGRGERAAKSRERGGGRKEKSDWKKGELSPVPGEEGVCTGKKKRWCGDL